MLSAPFPLLRERFHSSLAELLINEAREKANSRDSLPGEAHALAIDPGYGPALLTVVTHEILLGRIEEGWSFCFPRLSCPVMRKTCMPSLIKPADFSSTGWILPELWNCMKREPNSIRMSSCFRQGLQPARQEERNSLVPY